MRLAKTQYRKQQQKESLLRHNKIMSLLRGRTIVSVDARSINHIMITFDDGGTVVFDTGTGPYGISTIQVKGA